MKDNLIFLGFLNPTDAHTFKMFLEREGYENVAVQAYDQNTRIYKVWFKPKDNK